jgi:predicted ATPase
MPLSAVSIKNYRSVRHLWLPVEQLSIFVGANGVGKTNLYKALALLRSAADGTIMRAIAEESGLNSVFGQARAPIASRCGWSSRPCSTSWNMASRSGCRIPTKSKLACHRSPRPHSVWSPWSRPSVWWSARAAATW